MSNSRFVYVVRFCEHGQGGSILGIFASLVGATEVLSDEMRRLDLDASRPEISRDQDGSVVSVQHDVHGGDTYKIQRWSVQP